MDFSSKADAVLAEGERKRGEYDPDPNSVPYRLYQDYVRRGGYVPPRGENFCHFWRVVVFWAPLRWLADHTVNTDGFKSFMKTKVGGFFKGIGRVISSPFRLIGAGNDRLEDRFGQERMASFWLIVTMSILAICFLGILALGTADSGWLFPVVVLGSMAAVGLLSWGISVWAAHLEIKRREKANAAWEAKMEAIENGTYDALYGKKHKEPGKVKKFFKGVGDFLVLLAQIIRVNKWKICPLVNIDPRV